MTNRSRTSIMRVLALALALAAPDVSRSATQDVHLLALRVEFPYEVRDDFTTGGRGVFDMRTPAEALAAEGDSAYRYPYDAPPHDAAFLEAHLSALARYVDVASRGEMALTWEVYPPAGQPAYVAPRELVWYGSAPDDDEQLRRWVTFLADATELAEPDAGPLARFDSYLVFNASISLQGALSTEFPALALTEQEVQRSGVDLPPGVTSGWVVPQQIQTPGGVIGLNGTFAATFLATRGLPVLLNTATSGSALGGWTLMDIGSDNLVERVETGRDTVLTLGFIPCLPMAWEQARLGWVEPTVIRADTTIRLAGLAVRNSDLPRAVKVPITPDEYLLLELRRSITDEGDFADWDHPDIARSIDDTSGVWLEIQGDNYDAYTPGTGVLIYHVDEARIRQWEPVNEINAHRERPGIFLVESDGYRDVGITNLLGHPRSSEGIGSPNDPFAVSGDTLYATGEWEPGHPVSLANDETHSGIQIITSPYGVTGDSVTLDVEWVGSSPGPERSAKYLGSPIVEGVTVGRLFEEWTGESTDPMVIVATEAGSLYVLDSNLDPVHTATGAVGGSNIGFTHKPQIIDVGKIRVHGDDAFAEFRYTSSGWTVTEVASAPWEPPPILADLDRDGIDYEVAWTSDGTIRAIKAGVVAWTYGVGDSLVGQPTVGAWGQGGTDGYGYAYMVAPRRLTVLSRTGVEVRRIELGRSDSTEWFSRSALTYDGGAIIAGVNVLYEITLTTDGEAQSAKRAIPGHISGVPAITALESGGGRAYVPTYDGWLYGIGLSMGEPLWSQLYADARHSNSLNVARIPGTPPPIVDLMPSDKAFCYPSPVGNTAAKLRFYLTRQADIEARVYTGAGELVWRGELAANATTANAANEIVWPGGTQFVSGLYLIRLEATAADGERAGVTIPVGIAR